MKTSKSIQQIAADFRKTNEKAKSKVFQYSALEVNTEIKRQDLIANERKLFEKTKTVRQLMNERIMKRLNDIARHLPESKYSMGEEKKVFFSTLTGECDKRRYYGWIKFRNRERHGYVALRLSIEELLRTKIIGGIITKIGNEVEHKIYEVQITEIKGKFGNGFVTWSNSLYLTGNFHGYSIEVAKSWRKIRAQKLQDERKARRAKIEFDKYYEKAKNLFYGYEHSINAGNCEAGTELFANEKGLNKEFGYRGDFLLQIANGRTKFVEHMIVNRALNLQKISDLNQ